MRYLIYPLLLSLSNLALADNSPAELSKLQTDAQQRIKSFSAELKAALKAAISNGGLPNGVQVCKEQAPLIAEKWSTDGWQIGRTSLKVRNSANSADSWEQNVLQGYAAKLANGSMPAQLKHAEIVGSGSTQVFRYMQPIMLDSMCVACHGSAVAAQVQQKIQQHYPDDLATGFNPGELRGAFTLQKQL
ncbi:Tll0287-like domain-containing protein [Rheinheimera gaetbuli]